MSFFQDIETKDEVETGGLQGIIPANTKLECAVVSAGWIPETQHANEAIELKLHVLQPGPYKDYIVGHKLHVKDDSEKKAKRGKEFLASYDAKGKGLLRQADAAGKNFTDALLARALVGVKVMATFDIWEKDVEKNGVMVKEPGGNWVRAIGNVSKTERARDAQIERKAEEVKAEMDLDDFDDSEIPF